MAKTLSPAEKLLRVYQKISPYAETASRFDFDGRVRKQASSHPLIDALLPQGGVVGIIQGINVARPGPHKHAHEYYLGRIEDCYFMYFHDDESRWPKKDGNGRLTIKSFGLSHLGCLIFAGIPGLSLDHILTIYKWSGEITHNGLDSQREQNRFDYHLAQNFVHFFETPSWQFKPNGDPSIKAMRTGDGQTVEPLDTLELLQVLQTHGHAQFPDQMIHYMRTLGAARG